jgi:hypothetical protein
MEFRLGRFAGRLGFALALAGSLLGASPAGAASENSSVNSFHERLESAASALKSTSARAIASARAAAVRVVQDNQDVLRDAQSELSAGLSSFRSLLNAQKAKFGMIGENAAAGFDVWTDQAAQTWAEMHRATLETLNRLRDWIAQHSGENDEPIHV